MTINLMFGTLPHAARNAVSARRAAPRSAMTSSTSSPQS